ncbi:MAG: rRNA maturation RNase YbeY [Oscillospiraceae bacterium]|jgi:probable rRNA maturation factor|nr:rRNA maturation RNase YbeY [Oscillospiraceae bacterium]
MNNKIKHKISASNQSGVKLKSTFISLLKQAITVTLRYEKVDYPCAINILISNNAVIRDLNKRFSDIDKITDVLSFQMQEFEYPGWSGLINKEFDIEAGNIPLGDIVISLPKVTRQANAIGVTIEQESTLLMIHSCLHLLGYDHDNDDSAKLMREIETYLMRNMGYLDYRTIK